MHASNTLHRCVTPFIFGSFFQIFFFLYAFSTFSKIFPTYFVAFDFISYSCVGLLLLLSNLYVCDINCYFSSFLPILMVSFPLCNTLFGFVESTITTTSTTITTTTTTIKEKAEGKNAKCNVQYAWKMRSETRSKNVCKIPNKASYQW